MAESTAFIPTPESDDPDDVTTALETASALWGIGDQQEALRWLRRAAEAAEEAGNDLRSVRLARAAAELRGQLESEAEARPGHGPAPAPAAQAADAELATAPYHDRPTPPSPTVAGAAPRPPSMRPPPKPPQPGGKRPPPPSAAQPTPAPPAVASATAAIPPTPAAERPPRGPLPVARPRPPQPAEEVPSPGAPLTPVAAGPAASEGGPDVWHALRVSVKRSVRDPSLFVVRRLDDGHAAPPGSREALIMVLTEGADLFASSNRGRGD